MTTEPLEDGVSAPGAAPGAPQDAAGDLSGDLSGDTAGELAAELAALREQHARAVADYQNLRRRQAEDRVQQARMLEADLVRRYLPVLDDLDRALASVAEEADIREHRWVEGIRMVQRKFEQVLASHGVEEIPADGEPFDPTHHEALGYVPGPEGQVMHLVHRGYRIGDVTVRPAAVMVGNGEPPGGPAGE